MPDPLDTTALEMELRKACTLGLGYKGGCDSTRLKASEHCSPCRAANALKALRERVATLEQENYFLCGSDEEMRDEMTAARQQLAAAQERIEKLEGAIRLGADHEVVPDYGVLAYASAHKDRWCNRGASYWFARLVQEVGELGSSLVGDHPGPVEHELRQISSISINWLRVLAAAPQREEGE